MLVEIHMIQNHAPSNLNRDDTGSPKDCLFGGVLRARLSSQCLKRSIRLSDEFASELKGHLGTRTRRLPIELKKTLIEKLGCQEADATLIATKASGFGSSKETADLTTRQLIFLGDDEVEALAGELKALLATLGNKAFTALKTDDLEAKLARKLPRSIDIALFGRMTTSKLFDDVEATMQVAHAISTHKITRQFDYYTGVDDLNKAAEETGAGMIGDIEFNSATYYKYFSLDWDSFVKALGGDVETARKALGAFIRAAALSTPTGKQNTFAAHNLPDAILVEIKAKKQPVSYANAFVKPVRADAERDIVGASIAAFSDYRTRLCSAYGIKPEMAAYLAVREDEIAGAEKVGTLDKLIEATIVTLDGRTVGQ